MIQIKCPQCGEIQVIPKEYRDKVVKCLSCKKGIIVTDKTILLPYVEAGPLEKKPIEPRESLQTVEVKPIKRASNLPRCQLCNGIMKRKIIMTGTFSGLLINGILFVLGILLLPLGIFLCLICGLLFISNLIRHKRVLRCENCRAIVERG